MNLGVVAKQIAFMEKVEMTLFMVDMEMTRFEVVLAMTSLMEGAV